MNFPFTKPGDVIAPPSAPGGMSSPLAGMFQRAMGGLPGQQENPMRAKLLQAMMAGQVPMPQQQQQPGQGGMAGAANQIVQAMMMRRAMQPQAPAPAQPLPQVPGTIVQ